MARSTRARVAGAIETSPLITRETVWWETRARRPTSRIVARFFLSETVIGGTRRRVMRPCDRSQTSSRIAPVSTGHIAEATVRVNAGAALGPIRRIWTSFGYDEINWTSTPAGRRALRVIGEFAEQPYYVRSHYIFNSGIGWAL